jgi:hypothetical protein
MFTLGAISLVVFLLRFVLFTFQESPRYLLGKGKDEQALEVLHTVAKTNRRECSINMQTFDALSDDHSSGSSSCANSNSPVLNLQAPVEEKPSLLEKAKAELKRISVLFSTPVLARLTVLVWTIYAFDYWGFSVAGKFAKPQQIEDLHSHPYRLIPTDDSCTQEFIHLGLDIRNIS